jgi:hypothetical protein
MDGWMEGGDGKETTETRRNARLNPGQGEARGGRETRNVICTCADWLRAAFFNDQIALHCIHHVQDGYQLEAIACRLDLYVWDQETWAT